MSEEKCAGVPWTHLGFGYGNVSNDWAMLSAAFMQNFAETWLLKGMF